MAKKVLSFISKSGTGKTTLLESVIAELKGRGRTVGVIKHDAHGFDIDRPGKDSHRLFAAGADAVAIASPEKTAYIARHERPWEVEALVESLFARFEIVLTEGFKTGPFPKIEVHRRERSDALLCRGVAFDPTLIAVVSDTELHLDVPVLPLDDPRRVADFVEAWFSNI